MLLRLKWLAPLQVYVLKNVSKLPSWSINTLSRERTIHVIYYCITVHNTVCTVAPLLTCDIYVLQLTACIGLNDCRVYVSVVFLCIKISIQWININQHVDYYKTYTQKQGNHCFEPRFYFVCVKKKPQKIYIYNLKRKKSHRSICKQTFYIMELIPSNVGCVRWCHD